MLKNFALFAFLLPFFHGTIIFFTFEFKFFKSNDIFQRFWYSMSLTTLGITAFINFLAANAVFLAICAYFIRKKSLLSMIAAVDSIAVFSFLLPVLANEGLSEKSWIFIFIVPPLSFAVTYCLVSLREIGALPEETVPPSAENQNAKKGLAVILVIAFYAVLAPVAGGVIIEGVKGFCQWRKWSVSLPAPFNYFRPGGGGDIFTRDAAFEIFKIFLHGFYIGPLFYLIQRAWAKIARGMKRASGFRFRAVRETSLLFAVHVLFGFLALHSVVADKSVIFTSAYWRFPGLLISVIGIIIGVVVFLLYNGGRDLCFPSREPPKEGSARPLPASQ
jgi:hypothetical protein